MVIRIVMTVASKKMTIAMPPETILKRAENRVWKGAKCLYFVKDCYFYAPRATPKHPRLPQKSSWFVENSRELCPEKGSLRLYIYTLSSLVLHKYTAACKGFSMVCAMVMAMAEPMAFPLTGMAPLPWSALGVTMAAGPYPSRTTRAESAAFMEPGATSQAP